MAYHLICVHPFHHQGRNIQKGERISDPAEVIKHSDDREHHFVRVYSPDLSSSLSEPAAPHAE